MGLSGYTGNTYVIRFIFNCITVSLLLFATRQLGECTRLFHLRELEELSGVKGS